MYIRHLIPPRIETDTIARKVLCHRPSRSALPRIDSEYRGNQLIGYNYGHIGSGWTLGPGSAKHLVDQIEQHISVKGITKNDEVTIIGAGVSGLMTAYELIKRGFTRIAIVAEQFNDLASGNASGLFMPSPIVATQKGQTIALKALYGHQWYSSILDNTHEDFRSGVRAISAYFPQPQVSFDTMSTALKTQCKNVMIDFGTGRRLDACAYDEVLFIDACTMLIQLSDCLRACNVQMIQQSIPQLAIVESSIVIICAGLGARQLAPDPGVRAIQGHQLVLKNQDIRIADYALSFDGDSGLAQSGHLVKRSVYFHPKRLHNSAESDIGVIGATHVQGASAETPNEQEFELMLHRARTFFGV